MDLHLLLSFAFDSPLPVLLNFFVFCLFNITRGGGGQDHLHLITVIHSLVTALHTPCPGGGQQRGGGRRRRRRGGLCRRRLASQRRKVRLVFQGGEVRGLEARDDKAHL